MYFLSPYSTPFHPSLVSLVWTFGLDILDNTFKVLIVLILLFIITHVFLTESLDESLFRYPDPVSEEEIIGAWGDMANDKG